MPALFIITGSNGAGKSTVGASYLPVNIQQKYSVFDGDKLALQKRKELHVRIKSLKEARRMTDDWLNEFFLEQAETALKANDHFAYEGHFRDDRSWIIPKRFKKEGYFLSLIFMGVADPNQSELRVIDRAKYGGHNVPRYEIEANFYGNLQKVNRNYKLFNELNIIDTSKTLKPKILLHMRDAEILSYTPSKDQPDWFIEGLFKLFKLIKKEEKTNSAGYSE